MLALSFLMPRTLSTCFHFQGCEESRLARIGSGDDSGSGLEESDGLGWIAYVAGAAAALAVSIEAADGASPSFRPEDAP